MARGDQDPLSRNSITLYLEESVKQGIREFMIGTDTPNVNQAISILIRTALGQSHDGAAIAVARRNAFGQLIGFIRRRLAEKLREIALELDTLQPEDIVKED